LNSRSFGRVINELSVLCHLSDAGNGTNVDDIGGIIFRKLVLLIWFIGFDKERKERSRSVIIAVNICGILL